LKNTDLKNDFIIQIHNTLQQKNDGLTTSSNFMIMNEYGYWVFLKQLNEEQRLIFDNFMFKKKS